MAKTIQPEKFTEANGWLTDKRGNKASFSYWGTREAAERSLRSLEDCDDCINCSVCSGCSDCSRCSDCSGCSRCSVCSGCSVCSRCSVCSGCSRCSGLYEKIGVNATELGETNNGPPPVPTIPNIHETMFAAVSQKGALDMGQWHKHKCEKTHCRAGWAVALAGEPGFALEKFYGGEGSGTTLAAMLIYDASDPSFKINPSRFFDENDAALADMKRLAEAEAA